MHIILYSLYHLPLILIPKYIKEGRMYDREEDQSQKLPSLCVRVEVTLNGNLIITGQVEPESEIESNIAAALANIRGAAMHPGRFEVFLPCLGKKNPEELAYRLETFRRLFTKRSRVNIVTA